MDAVCVVYVATYLYIFILLLKSKKGKTDVDTMCGNASLTGSYPESLCPTISDTDTMMNKCYGKCKAYATSERLRNIMYD